MDDFVSAGDLSDSYVKDWAEDHYEEACVGFMAYLFGVAPEKTDVAWDVVTKAMKRDFKLEDDYQEWLRGKFGDRMASDFNAQYVG